MKIKVKDLEANPFKNYTKYPLDRTKIRDLKISIKENGFWGGLLVRKHPTKKGKYQMAFGHHRHQTAKELGIKEIDCMVHDLSDDDMLHRMFAENHETWGMLPVGIIQNVESARDRLADILEKNTWEDLGENTKMLWTDEFQFLQTKGHGVGRTTILNYLGGLYNENEVKTALNILSEPENGISVDAAKQLQSMSHVRYFRAAVNKYKIPKAKHTEIAKQVTKEDVGRRGIEDVVAEHALPKIRKKVRLAAKKPTPTLDKYVEITINDLRNVRLRLGRIKSNLSDIEDMDTRDALMRECDKLMVVINDLKIKENKDVKKTA